MSGLTPRETKRLERSFSGPLSPRQRARLEADLAASAPLAERYRRLQLMERVAAHGPHDALETPSFLETERVAERLGLLEPAPRPRSWRAALPPWVFGAALVASVGLALLVVLPPPPQDVLQTRGEGGAQVSFAAYRLSADGAFTPVQAGAELVPSDRLKLRLSWASAPGHLEAVWVALVAADGRVKTTRLSAPEGAIAAVPGVVDLWGLPPGPAELYVIGTQGELSPAALRSAVLARGSDVQTQATLGAAGVMKVSVQMRAGGDAAP